MKLTISKKLIGSFAIIALLLGITSSISTYYLQKIDDSSSDLIQRRVLILYNVQNVNKNVSVEFSRLRGFMISKDEKSLEGLQTSYNNVSSLIQETTKIVRMQDIRVMLQNLDQKNKEFKQKYDQLIARIQSNRPSSEIMDYYKNEVVPIGSQLEPIAEKIEKEQLASMKASSVNNTNIVKHAITNVSWISILAILLAIVIGYFSSRMISRPILSMAKIAERVAEGDLTNEDIHVRNKDEIGNLANSFNQMTGNLRNLVRQISLSSEHIASSSEELTASADQSTQASASIARTLQKVTSNADAQSQSVCESVQAMHEMSSGIQQIASGAQVTSSLMVQTSQKALEGNEIIHTTVKQINAIHGTMEHLANGVTEMAGNSREIERIVTVINEIAAQTNLLALNAAIEAARAGEQGRGFAVVAGEVQKLAEQSSQSANQIASLITTIQNHTYGVVDSVQVGVKEVNEGIRVVRVAGELFEEIKHNIDKVSDQVHHVSASSEQISASSEQVLNSMSVIAQGADAVALQSQHVSASTEEQLASMEEIAAAAAFLSKMAEDLQHAVGEFKV
ncbi:methyl-accepting chemotaxis protein [Paenibacillus shirakamiensis]|uniref:Methyl-accepting chemotaxis protein n=1 Tax=Paenibacillus shirakamiensis TaxID=1265935 RepID=A0ABS4JJW5_9BACL|nr:methyl-accepting chemotaxis protein [Paenibacillus shirakamiensis]MBP2001391.1 methyl-accepting chemotaxis protein [Paenibacillus shirakamiensis]